MILHHLTGLRGLNCLSACHNREKSHPWRIGTYILWAFRSVLWKRAVSLLPPCTVAPSSPPSVVLTAAVRAFQKLSLWWHFHHRWQAMTTTTPSCQLTRLLLSGLTARPLWASLGLIPRNKIMSSKERTTRSGFFFNTAMFIKVIPTCLNLLCFHIQPKRGQL